jgi:hypothetical protein
MMLIDRAVAAYRDFIRIAGWTGNAALMVEHEFFGSIGPAPTSSIVTAGRHPKSVASRSRSTSIA